MKEKIKNKEGITLIALVITIVVLLILAAVSISMLTGENGILTQAQNASTQTEIAEAKEQAQMDILAWQSERLENGQDATLNDETVKTILTGKDYVKELKDTSFISTKGDHEIQYSDLYTNGNNQSGQTVVDGVTVPSGFTHIAGESKEAGIVVADSKGNEFVWVPVTKKEDGTATAPYVATNGMLTKKDGTQVEIQLGRYNFNTTTGEPSAYSGSRTEDTPENHNPDYGNAIAINIENFKTSVEENGGYYIARYEAGVTGDTAFSAEDMEDEYTAPNDTWTGYDGDSNDIVIKSGEKVWNYVTQKKASELCINLKTSNGYTDVTSDLVNSYAWDTAIVFIQKCGTDNNYANQTGLSTTPDNPSNLGKAILAEGNGKDKADTQCNIYDMAGNCAEWTTETFSDSYYPCVGRGGGYNSSVSCTSDRGSVVPTFASVDIAFRPLLYL